MITLNDLILSVKDKTLPREALEAYGDQLSALFAEMCLEMADLEKEEALFISVTHTTEKDSVALRKVFWKATPSGQRLIMLKRYLLATKEMINSLKSRVYRLIY